MNSWELLPVLLLLVFSIALSAGLSIILAVVRQARRRKAPPPLQAGVSDSCPYERTCLFRRPNCWLAIKSRNLGAVQTALGLHNPKPCSWSEGLEEKLFIAPPVRGWIIVMGSGLPEPGDDVDACFRFLIELSRKLGQVQFFSASRILHYHAWVRADHGRVVRAYAWAGHTLWHQGPCTSAEKELNLKCYDYTESAERPSFNLPEPVAINVDKVPLLAARWSLDPARIDERSLETALGVAGEPSRRY